MGQSSVLIVVKPETDLSAVKSDLGRRGLAQIQELPSLKMLRGVISDAGISSLRDVAGVASVEREREIQLPPPNSPVQ